MDEIVSILDRLINLQLVSKQAIEKIFGIPLQLQSNSNPYWNTYEATFSGGPLTRIQYREPGSEATSQTRGVILTVRTELQLTEPKVRNWYGPGTIEQIIPTAQPEGLINYKYERNGQTLFLTYRAQSYRLGTVTFWR